MSDGQPPRPDRPRPKYGEYATPQEQAEIVAKSLPPVSPALVPKERVTPEPVADASRPASSTGAVGPTRRRWDVVLSYVLLGYALFNALAGFAQYSDLGAAIQAVYDTQGIGAFEPTALSSVMGPVIIITNVVVFVIAAFFTIRRLRANKLGFWVVLVAGVIGGLATGTMLAIVIVNDPAFISFASSMN